MSQHTILYVDDEYDNLTSFKAVFRRQYRILLAESGAEAIEVLKKEPIQLLITDQRMPKMTGVQLLEQIKEDYPDIIRMVLTGYSDMQAIIDAINKGKVYHYITKPWKVEEVKIIISKALEMYELRRRNHELERSNVLAQFEILKNQINPHFLFNSMNILAAIIPTKPKLAVEFTNRFARLYRSVLQLREQLVITLEEELKFVRDYFYLQKMRFGESLHLTIDIADYKLSDTLPPFALQILVENAVKHNIVSEDDPLVIKLFDEKDFLIVENSYQPRGTSSDSTGTGLENLKARYALLGLNSVEANEQGGKFVAKIPLIREA